MQLKYRMTVPYGGRYSIVDPASGIRVEGTTFDHLMNGMYAQRKANSIPIGLGFEQEVEKWVCEAYPAECDNLDPNLIKPRRLTLQDLIVGSRTMLSHWWNGRKIVDRSEAERRAKICMACPLNVAFDKPCSGVCAELQQIVSAITNAQGTQYDKDLRSCQICGCFLQAAIWVEAEIQTEPLTYQQKEQFKGLPNCWKGDYLRQRDEIPQN